MPKRKAEARSSALWARREFGRAKLGDKRRTDRLVAIGARVADSPAGCVSQAIPNPAEREGAYRLLEAGSAEAREICRSAALACAKRAADEQLVIVPVDGTGISLSVSDHRWGVGPIGARSSRARGVLVVSAIGVTAAGVPVGLLGQSWWSRPDEPDPRPRRKRRLEEKETWHYLNAITSACEGWKKGGAKGRLWFQIDRGGDFRHALLWGTSTDHLLTVRAAHDRRVRGDDQHAEYLWAQLEAEPALGSYDLDVAASHGRKARHARMEVRARSVQLALRDRWRKTQKTVVLNAVLVREVSLVPAGEEPLEWMLLTNHSVGSLAEARFVVDMYALRWRIEDFHKTWKVACKVEECQLMIAESIEGWATILAAVAMRIQRLTHFARHNPDAPASLELSDHEIEAVMRLTCAPGYRVGDVPPLSKVVHWIAQLGGYTGKSSGGPPGAVTIARGLARLDAATQVVASIRNSKD